MTPIQIEILLHYHCSPEEYRDGDLSAPAVEEALHWFVANGLLQASAEPRKYGATYETTERGRVLVDALCCVPLPERKWEVPGMPTAWQER